MTTPLRPTLLALLWLVASAFAAEPPAPTFPLWDGHESVAQYAARTNLPPTKTLDLGNGVKLELVLIPAGKFVMGTPEPEPVDEETFLKKIVMGKALLAAGGGILLVLICSAILRAIRQKRRFQYSLRRFMAMAFAASLGVLGGMHWWHSARTLAQAQAEYAKTMGRYREADSEEKPAHDVTITQPFLMGKYPVTQEQYEALTGSNPSHFKGAKNPVENVSWHEVQEFCKKLNERTAGVSPARTEAGGTPAVRLPTEAEREYACRAGTKTTYHSGDEEADLARVAWYGSNSGHSTHPVGQKEPNAFGLYDMHGNVVEWCADCFGVYGMGAATNPPGPVTGDWRLLRGGAWIVNPRLCRSATRGYHSPDVRHNFLGFRVVVARTP